MKPGIKAFWLALLLAGLSGCAQNFYNVPLDTVQSRIKVVGVAPILVDAGSDIRHPEKDALVGVIKEYNRKNERELVRLIKEKNEFFSVRFVEEDADALYSALVERGEKRDDAKIVYNKYFFKKETVSRLIRDNGLDTLLIVMVSGITHRDKRNSSNLLSYLESDYNDLIMTAQMVDVEGNVVWEYPNFRRRMLSSPNFYALQYPDFDEALANETDKVEVKFKTIPGITRAFQKKEKGIIRGETRLSRLYYTVFDDMLSLLHASEGVFGGKKDNKTDVNKK